LAPAQEQSSCMTAQQATSNGRPTAATRGRRQAGRLAAAVMPQLVSADCAARVYRPHLCSVLKHVARLGLANCVFCHIKKSCMLQCAAAVAGPPADAACVCLLPVLSPQGCGLPRVLSWQQQQRHAAEQWP
jgi:hypothetical protein